jgi:hypothetical protein
MIKDQFFEMGFALKLRFGLWIELAIPATE